MSFIRFLLGPWARVASPLSEARVNGGLTAFWICATENRQPQGLRRIVRVRKIDPPWGGQTVSR